MFFVHKEYLGLNNKQKQKKQKNKKKKKKRTQKTQFIGNLHILLQVLKYLFKIDPEIYRIFY